MLGNGMIKRAFRYGCFATALFGLAACGELGSMSARNAPIPNTYFIFFEQGTADLSADSQGIIAEVSGYMQRYPELAVNVVGHRSQSEPTGLDERRALAAGNALASSGVTPTRINLGARGVAESIAAAAGSDASADQRVDLLIQVQTVVASAQP